jgi:hypothetical protein
MYINTCKNNMVTDRSRIGELLGWGRIDEGQALLTTRREYVRKALIKKQYYVSVKGDDRPILGKVSKNNGLCDVVVF